MYLGTTKSPCREVTGALKGTAALAGQRGPPGDAGSRRGSLSPRFGPADASRLSPAPGLHGGASRAGAGPTSCGRAALSPVRTMAAVGTRGDGGGVSGSVTNFHKGFSYCPSEHITLQ